MTALGTSGLPLFGAPKMMTSVEMKQMWHRALTAPTPPSVPCPTSADAARGVEASGKAARDRATILAYLRSRPDGATEAEIATALGLSGDSLRPRMRELGDGFGKGPHATMGMGKIERTDETRVVPGHRAALVWRVR